MSELRRDIWLTVLYVGATFGIGAAVGHRFHASFGHFMLALATVLIGAGLSVGALIVLVVKKASRSRDPSAGQEAKPVVLYAGLTCVAAMVSILVGIYRQEHLLTTAKAWAEQQIPAIEAYRSAHGAYPESLAAVVDLASVPGSARAFDVEVHGRGANFSLVLYTGPLSGWDWSSSRREWSYFN